jgi:hypothetical protein
MMPAKCSSCEILVSGPKIVVFTKLLFFDVFSLNSHTFKTSKQLFPSIFLNQQFYALKNH